VVAQAAATANKFYDNRIPPSKRPRQPPAVTDPSEQPAIGLARCVIHREPIGYYETEDSMLVLNDSQKALVIEASAIADRATNILLEMFDATRRADKLRLLEDFHRLNLQEIDLLRQAGDPASAKKLARETRNYEDLRTYYLTMDGKAASAAREFEAARWSAIHERIKLRD
jgi:hypothetical protein